MNDMQVFENPMLRCELRTLEKDGEIWFVAADVCRALNHTNVSVALQMLEEDEVAKQSLEQVSENGVVQNREMNIISEPGLYTLVIRSNRPEAKAFKRWVTHEVLPTIRRTGRYGARPERGDMTLVEAAQMLATCDPEVRPCIHKLLSDAGFDLPPLQLPRPIVQTMDKARFAEWFRQSYEGRGMTYQEVADALSTNRVNVYRWGHGVSRPRAPYMRTITEYFGPCPEE